MFTGAPTVMLTTKSFTLPDLWTSLSDSDKQNYVMTGACMSGYQGLIGGHAYTVIGVKTLLDASGSEAQKLVLVRNPWGSDNYVGPWGDNSSLWSAAYKTQVPDRKWGNDGTFFMALSDF